MVAAFITSSRPTTAQNVLPIVQHLEIYPLRPHQRAAQTGV